MDTIALDIVHQNLEKAKRVLVVDDEPGIVRFICYVLNRDGFQTLSCSDGREALDVLRLEAVDLVLSDVRMPEMGGIELLREIKQTVSPSPVLFITGYSELSTADALGLGAVGLLSKPVDCKKLLQSVRDFFA